MRVALLAGGRSSEHDVSLASAESVRAGLAEAGHEPELIEIARDGRWTLAGERVELVPGEPLAGAEIAFPVLHGPYGEDGTVQGLLETLGMPYVGAGVLASALCMDKAMFKAVLAAAVVPQIDHEVLRIGDDPKRAARLGMPLFVKPARLGSSVGISKVSSAEAELERALELAWAHDPVALVERFAGGMEVECSVIGNEETLTSQPGEVVAHADWYDYEAKYSPGGMELIVPARLGEHVRERIRELTAEVFRLTGCEGYARADFFVLDGGEVLVNELNTIPGFTPTSGFPKMFEASGLPYPELLDRLLSLALERFERERGYRF